MVALLDKNSFSIEPAYFSLSATRSKFSLSFSVLASIGPIALAPSSPNIAVRYCICNSFGSLVFTASRTAKIVFGAFFCTSFWSCRASNPRFPKAAFCKSVIEPPFVKALMNAFIPVAATSASAPAPMIVAAMAAVCFSVSPATLPRAPYRFNASPTCLAIAALLLLNAFVASARLST